MEAASTTITGSSLVLIEDDETIGRLLTEALADKVYEMQWHHLGREALAWLRHSELDVALLDIGLPDIDGVEACRRLWQRIPSPLVMMQRRPGRRE